MAINAGGAILVTDYHSSHVTDLQVSLDRMRAERDLYRQIAKDLFDYFVEGTGTSRCVATYIEHMYTPDRTSHDH